MARKNRTNREWLDDIEDSVDGLKERRGDMRKLLRDADFEAEDLWAGAERRWRRLESKLRKAEELANSPINGPRVRNVDRLIESIDETYFELEGLLE